MDASAGIALHQKIGIINVSTTVNQYVDFNNQDFYINKGVGEY